jgi:hypothetical protein
MKGWLRRLRGGVVGVVLAVDVDSPVNVNGCGH